MTSRLLELKSLWLDKPILLPERPKSKNTPTVPEFVRNVMGSSAGAGSGEFHVYRHLRRKEYSRQKFIKEKGKKELLDEEYHRKLEENKQAADQATAKKRAKRLKRKQKQKQQQNKKSKQIKSENSRSDCTDTSDEEKDAEENTELKSDEPAEAHNSLSTDTTVGNNSNNGSESKKNSSTDEPQNNSNEDSENDVKSSNT
ncbi:PRKR-interacting protein 1 homolog isoform X2 [Athalia rosae]|uniref:PRKR-interacting protein 1 homolog isoform X2 n=1 Tax=Athalia rosae TaxID=37344 RepID=UPI0020333657|nr:PRKR-interacting protein 1 homolog isoform X2 [Athalia rosae]XP_048508366.1 PRKR-interacting protein 1 homolog isoform X2 [Athalia rosae]XP_048508367.1 PRKR-interacting protein 1 homolog isoform X2 [Athalia rosae]